MIILLDTSTSECRLSLVEDERTINFSWLAERNLSKGLHGFIIDKLRLNEKTLSDVTAIGVFEGPGSYTGLRIGISLVNSLAQALGIVIVGARGDDWQKIALEKIKLGQNEKMIIPYYGSEFKVTPPRK